MNIPLAIDKTLKLVKSNAPEILSALAVSGVVTTSYLIGKASFAASEVIRTHEDFAGTPEDPKERIKERTKHVWRLYVPSGISAGLTIVCIVGANKSGNRQAAAAITAYSITEKAFSEYREKVAEQIGKGKEQAIRDEVAQDAVKHHPVTREVHITGTGEVMCFEMYTSRYFKSDMETLRKAQNDINAMVVNNLYVTLDEFYDLIGLEHTSMSDKLGWDSDKLMDLRFSAVMGRNNEPCLAFEYNYLKPL